MIALVIIVIAAIVYIISKEKKEKKEQERQVDAFMGQYEKMRQLSIEQNTGREDDFIDDSMFGLEVSKPYFVAGDAQGVLLHLNTLKTIDGESLTFTRRGSFLVDDGNVVDKYEGKTSDGSTYGAIYVNEYCSRTSSKPPAGYRFD